MVTRIENVFQKGDIVWAKVKGFSWWPGQIQYQIHHHRRNSESNLKEKIYRVNFIGHSSHCDVPISNIIKFEEKLDEFSKTKKNSLIKSIEKAKNLYFNLKKNILVNDGINIKEEDSISVNSNSDYSLFKYNEKKKGSIFGKTQRNDVKILKPIKQKKSRIDEGTNTINDDDLYSNSEKIKIDITFNVTNNHNNTVINSFNDDNKKIVSNEKENSVNKGKKELKEINKEKEEEEEENLEEDNIKDIIDKLLRYHTEMPSSTNQKYVLNILNSLNDLEKEFKNINKQNIYSYAKDIISVLDSFTYNRNKDISSKSSDILPEIIEIVIKEVFDSENNEVNNLNDKINDIDIHDIKKDIEYLLLDNNKKLKNINNGKRNLMISKKLNNNRYNKGKNVNKIEVNDKDFQFIYDIFLKCMNEKDEINAKNEFNLIINNFFKNIYNKNNGLDIITANKRKQVCLKMLSLLKKILPNTNEDDIKKMIIFVEYKVRCEDPTLGRKYIKHIGSFYIKMKEIINGKE